MIHFEMVTPEKFRENDYFDANPDAVHEVLSGILSTAYDHYLNNRGQQDINMCATTICLYLEKTHGNIIEKPIMCFEQREHFVELSTQLMDDRYKHTYADPNFVTQEQICLSSQFTSESERYHERYFNPHLYVEPIRNALSKINIEYVNPFVFDMGSGSGNSVFACLELFENCSIVATDLSPDLLAILNKIKNERYKDAAVTTVAVDTQQATLSRILSIFFWPLEYCITL